MNEHEIQTDGTATAPPPVRSWPKITVVTPSFNQAGFIEQTLQSVLNQHYPNLEYYVVDGGSTDGTVEILRRYSERLTGWVSESDDGQSSAINKGFARSQGDVMTWLNSDDQLAEDALWIAGEIFATQPKVAWLTGKLANMSADGRMTTVCDHDLSASFLIRRGWHHAKMFGFLQQEGTFWRRELWDEAGGYVDTQRHYSLDFELWKRFSQHAELVTVPTVLGKFRLQPGQKSQNVAGYLREIGVNPRRPKLPYSLRKLTSICLSRLGLAARLHYQAQRGGWALLSPRVFRGGVR